MSDNKKLFSIIAIIGLGYLVFFKLECNSLINTVHHANKKNKLKWLDEIESVINQNDLFANNALVYVYRPPKIMPLNTQFFSINDNDTLQVLDSQCTFFLLDEGKYFFRLSDGINSIPFTFASGEVYYIKYDYDWFFSKFYLIQDSMSAKNCIKDLSLIDNKHLNKNYPDLFNEIIRENYTVPIPKHLTDNEKLQIYFRIAIRLFIYFFALLMTIFRLPNDAIINNHSLGVIFHDSLKSIQEFNTLIFIGILGLVIAFLKSSPKKMIKGHNSLIQSQNIMIEELSEIIKGIQIIIDQNRDFIDTMSELRENISNLNVFGNPTIFSTSHIPEPISHIDNEDEKLKYIESLIGIINSIRIKKENSD